MIGGFEQIVERRIREAAERGAFDDLSGHGKPIELEDEGADREQWLVNKVLKNAGCLPPWVEIAKEIDEIESNLDELQAHHLHWVQETLAELPESPIERAQRRPGIEAIHARMAERYRAGLEEMKELIALHNRFAPSENLHRPGFWMAARLRRFDEIFDPLASALGGAAVDAESVRRAEQEWEDRERRHRFYRKWKSLTSKLESVRAERNRQRR